MKSLTARRISATFTGEVTLEQGLTGNIGRLRRAIDEVRFVPPSGYIGGGVVVGGTPPISGTQQTLAGSTAIWDAIWATSNELLSDSAEHTRRAIILLTDGEEHFDLCYPAAAARDRGAGPSGNVRPASAVSAWAVTHTGVWPLVRE